MRREHQFPAARFLYLLVAVVLTGCDDNELPASPSVNATQVTSSEVTKLETDAAAIRQIGRALGASFAAEEKRATYLDAVRRSDLPQSQVSLHDFARTTQGRATLTAGALAVGQNPIALFAVIESLPRFALLLSREVRDTLSAEQTLSVVAALNAETGPFYVFDSQGNESVVDIADLPAGAVVTAFPQEGRSASSSAPEASSTTPSGVLGSFVYRENGTALLNSVVPSGSMQLDTLLYTFCDQPYGNNEILVKAYFHGEDGTSAGYGEYYDGDAPVYSAGNMCDHVVQGNELILAPYADVIQHAIPTNGAHWVRVEVWEDDCDCYGNDDDYYGSFEWRHGESGHLKEYQYNETDWQRCNLYSYAYCQYRGAVGARISWVSPPASELTVHYFEATVDTVWLNGEDVTVFARFKDQYGYRIYGSVDGWWSTNSSVLEVDNTSHYATSIRGVMAGEEQVYYTLNGSSRGGTVTVAGCPPPAISC